jgi:hypothetical protein
VLNELNMRQKLRQTKRVKERTKKTERLKLLNYLRLLLSIEPTANKSADQDQPNKIIFFNLKNHVVSQNPPRHHL